MLCLGVIYLVCVCLLCCGVLDLLYALGYGLFVLWCCCLGCVCFVVGLDVCLLCVDLIYHSVCCVCCFWD